ncbi:XTP/dITP diphosphohydrolase [Alkalibacillus flavidus]|uniref:dITP/XTP pyrophosphatase n=1 Tax=Alkalibacillus flavidus TaxID=546021 RepID=A0ABV2KSL8_9BACI
MTKTIYVATTNPGKINEFNEMLSPLNLNVKSLKDEVPQMDDVEETGETFRDNAILKAETYAERYQLPILADDSGLEVDALNGEPGVYSARYAGEAKNDEANIDKVLHQLENVSESNRDAAFVCVIAFAEPNSTTLTSEGKCAGSITDKRYGEHGFGYDPIFKPDGYDQTLAELGPEIKNTISHRRHALNNMLTQLETVLGR